MKKISAVMAIIMLFLNCGGASADYANAPLAMRVEAEWCKDSNIPLNLNGQGENVNNLPVFRNGALFSNGLAVGMSTANAIPQDGFYLKYNLSVPTSGFYDMDIMSSSLGSDWTSPYVISVNHGADLEMLASSASRIGDGYDGNWGKYQIRVMLNQGENQIDFISRKRPNLNPNASTFYLDYFELKYAGNQNTRVECEFFTHPSDSHIEVAADADEASQISGKKFLNFGGAYTEGMPPKTAQVYVFAQSDGRYKIKTGATILGVSYTGVWSITNEAGQRVDVNPQTATMVGEIVGFGNTLRHYELTPTMDLMAGLNILTIQAEPRGEDFTTYVDYIEFDKASKASQKIEIEAEDCVEKGYWVVEEGTPEASALSKGKSLKLGEKEVDWKNILIQDEFKISYDFDVAQGDSYELMLSMVAANGTSIMFSPMEIQIDGGKWVAFDNNNLIFHSIISGLTPVYNPAKYRYTERLSLSAGKHTISFRIRERRSNNYDATWYYCCFDKFELLTNTVFTDLNAKVAKPMLTENESTNVATTMFDDMGAAMSVADFDVSYTTDNNKILATDASGMVTAKQTGSANVIVRASHRKTGVELEKIVPVTVFSSYLGIKVHNIQKAGDNLMVEISNPINTKNPFSLIVVETAMENGYETSAKSVYMKDIKSYNVEAVTDGELHGIMPCQFIIPLHIATDSKITVYLWDSVGGMTSVWNSIIVE